MRNKIVYQNSAFSLLLGFFLMILTFSYSVLGAQPIPSLTYTVSLQPNQRGRVEIAVQGYNTSSMSFRILSTDTVLNAILNIGDASAYDSQNLPLSLSPLSNGWRVNNPGRGNFTFKYSFGTSLMRTGEYGTYFCRVSPDGAFFLNEVVFLYPDELPGRIEVVFQKPSSWTIGTSLTPLGNDHYSIPSAPDLKSGLIYDSTRMGVAEAVATENCGGTPITFIAYKPTSSYERFWYPAYGNSQVQQMQEYINLNCNSINYFKSIFGFWPGSDRYWISTFSTGVMERPTNYDHWMQAWPRERYSQVPHHTLHAWIWSGNPQASLLFNAEENSWFHEGIPSYYESKLTAVLTGNTMWRGALYPDYLITKRAAKFGLLKKGSVNNYALGCMRALAMDKKIAESTSGKKSLDHLLTVLGQRYGLSKTGFNRDEMLNTLTEVTGSNLNNFYQSYFSGQVSSELPPVDGYMIDYLGNFLQWLDYQLTSQTYMNQAKGFRTMFLIDIELALHDSIGYGSDEHSTATASGLYHLDKFRNAIGNSASVTKEKVIKTLSSLTGVDQSDFFEFYTVLGVTPSVNEIMAWLEKSSTTTTTVPPTTTTIAPSSEGGGGGGGCFIATAAYGSPMEYHVQILRDFRDRYLLDHKLGKKFVNLYYQATPQIAQAISKSETLRFLTRWLLIPFVGVAYLTINFGIMTTLLIITLAILLLISFVWVLRKTDIFFRHYYF
ncbi:MAG: hypothetical protein M1418_09625 [Deltaproteobacteria bacterium]|nr:hypothetical protein [Deltaproteobacteria bacterium]